MNSPRRLFNLGPNDLMVPWGFPDGSVGKESVCNAGDPSLIPGLGRSPGEGKGYPLQYSGLENSMNSMDCRVHGVQSQTRLSDFHFHWGDITHGHLYGSHTTSQRFGRLTCFDQ